MTLTVIGAGMAGLLAAAMFRSQCKYVLESQPGLPNNHSAVLRFRSTAVSDALNIPFKKVHVLKSVYNSTNPVADAMAYSLKCTGHYDGTRSIGLGKAEIVERYISPDDMILRMRTAVTAAIRYNMSVSSIPPKNSGDVMISTIPMPTLMKILKWKPQSEFNSVPGQNISFCVRDCNAYASLYVPDPKIEMSRISITGNKVIIEIPMPLGKFKIYPETIVRKAAAMLGIEPFSIMEETIQVREQAYSKILPIDEEERKKFIMWATDEHGIYSLGRYATWRPGLLLDDVVNDVRVIHRLMQGEGRYERKK